MSNGTVKQAETSAEPRGMRKLAGTENVTLAGVIELARAGSCPSGEGDVDHSDLNEAIREQAAAADAVLLGRG